MQNIQSVFYAFWQFISLVLGQPIAAPLVAINAVFFPIALELCPN